MEYVCEQCDKIFTHRKQGLYVPKFCSRKCHDDSRRGVYFVNNGSFIKGCTPNHTSFKKGQKAWNKNTKGICKPNKTSFKVGQNTGEKSYAWRGGITFRGGYCYVLKPSHPFAKKNRYIKRCILNAEKALGRFLTKEEVIHHINEVRSDDSLSNLYLFPNSSEHKRYHMLLRYKRCKPIIQSNLQE
jgi:hypothetical protein